jgi:hypothetical protein
VELGDCLSSVENVAEKPNAGLTRYLLRLPRSKLRILVGLITRHCPLEKHLHNMGRRSSIENDSTSLRIDGEQITKVASMKYLGAKFVKQLFSKLPLDASEIVKNIFYDVTKV